jgi:hypothetical protein
MQTAKHTVGTPRMNVAPTPAKKAKASKPAKTMDGLIDPDRAVAAAKVVAGSDGGKAKAKKVKAKAKTPAKKAKASKPAKKVAKKSKPATPSRPGLRDPFAGSLTAKMVSLLQRPNGATITEIMRTRPNLKGATPGATISAEISRLKAHWHVEKIGDGKNDARRFRIVGRRK